MSETPASPMTPNTTKSGRSARRIRKSKRIAAKIEMNTRKAKRTRHSARMDGCTPELKAAFAIMPPTPKNAAAVSAKEPESEPQRRSRGVDRGPPGGGAPGRGATAGVPAEASEAGGTPARREGFGRPRGNRSRAVRLEAQSASQSRG